MFISITLESGERDLKLHLPDSTLNFFSNAMFLTAIFIS